VVVEGRGFPSQTYNVQVEVCGNQALNGTADCNSPTARTTFTDAAGSFSLDLVVAMPPKPCPCVVVAFAPALSDLVTVPFAVIGAPEAAPAAPPPAFAQKTLKVEGARLEGNRDWQTWFGASTTRDLVFTVYNTGTAPVDDPPLVLTAGKGNNPGGVVTSPRVGHIEPGARRVVRAAVPFEPLSFGRYTVKGRIGNTGAEETFRVHTSTYPWGLFALVIVVLQIILLGMRNVLRRRVAAREARKQAAGAPDAAAMPDVDEVDSGPTGILPDSASAEIHWRGATRESSDSEEAHPVLAGNRGEPSNE
jgi:hypothetical protein